jgi:hypothetical protein
MTKSTPILTLTQSGPLAVLLQRQRDAVIQLDRHAHRKHMRAAFWKTLTWPFRALTARTLVDYTGRRQQIHDDLRIQHPEWVEPNGESSMRLLEQLDTLTRRGPNESSAAPQRSLEQGTEALSMAEGTSEVLGGCRAHGDPDRLRWRRTSIRQASEKLWAAA